MKIFKKRNFFKKKIRECFKKTGLFLFLGFMIWNTSMDFGFNNNSTVGSIYISNARAAETWSDQVTDILLEHGESKSVADKIFGFFADIQKVNPAVLGAKTLLLAVMTLIYVLVLFSAGLVDVVLNQEFVNLFLTDTRIYTAWSVVRDFLNLSFMMFLLFSAFATIFQVEKYHLKKITILLVVMALLVNFSYPIALFIIDFSNSAMYFFVDSVKVSTSAKLANFSGLGTAIYTSNGALDDFVDILLSIILLFTFFVTLFAVGINLLIRIIAFTMLLILSPAGIALSFFPSTKDLANSWWSAMFKYAFMGPALVFFIYLANFIFDISGDNTDDLVHSLIKYIVPISFLWIGLVVSSKFGGAASSTAMTLAKNTGNRIRGYSWGAVKMGAGATGVPGGIKQQYTNVSNKLKSGNQAREARIASRLGHRDAMNELERKNFEEDKKKMKNYNNDDLKREAEGGNIAAADELLSRKSLDVETYERAVSNSKNSNRNNDLTNKFKAANKETRIDVVASIDAKAKANDEVEINNMMGAHAGITRDRAREMILDREISGKMTKLNHTDFAKQDFEKIYKEIDDKLASADSMTRAEGMSLRDSIYRAHAGLDPAAKSEILKNLNESQSSTLRSRGVI